MQPVSHQTAASLLVQFFRSRAPGQSKVKEKCKKRTGKGQQKKRQRKGCHSVAGHQGKPKCKKTQQNFEVETSKSLALFFPKVVQKRKPLEHPKTGREHPRAPKGSPGGPRSTPRGPRDTPRGPKSSPRSCALQDTRARNTGKGRKDKGKAKERKDEEKIRRPRRVGFICACPGAQDYKQLVQPRPDPRAAKEVQGRTQGHPKRTQELPKSMCTPGH